MFNRLVRVEQSTPAGTPKAARRNTGPMRSPPPSSATAHIVSLRATRRGWVATPRPWGDSRPKPRQRIPTRWSSSTTVSSSPNGILASGASDPRDVGHQVRRQPHRGPAVRRRPSRTRSTSRSRGKSPWPRWTGKDRRSLSRHGATRVNTSSSSHATGSWPSASAGVPGSTNRWSSVTSSTISRNGPGPAEVKPEGSATPRPIRPGQG